jgi:hypothetical protein
MEDKSKEEVKDEKKDEEEIEVQLIKTTEKYNQYSVFGTEFIVDK